MDILRAMINQDSLRELENPEVEKKNVKLSIERSVLTLTGQREQDKESKGTRYHRVERAYGRFARSYTTPELVDEQKLTAEFETGCSRCTCLNRKKPNQNPKSIEVQVN